MHKHIYQKFIIDCSGVVKYADVVLNLQIGSFLFLKAHTNLFQVGRHLDRKDFWDAFVHYS